MLLPVALTFSAVMLAVCLHARSMKEAQSYMGPLMMLVIFPSMASMIPGLELNLGLAFVPVFNVTLLIRDALLQDYSHLGMMATVFAINLGYAGLALWAAVRMFQREEVIFRS
jgi:sodium transport system permease protein